MATQTDTAGEQYLKPRAVAELFGVTTHTVGRWAEQGLLRSVRVGAGHRRYVAADVEALRRSSAATADV